MRGALIVAGCFAASCVLAAQTPPDAAVAKVRANPKFTQAIAAIDRDHDRLVADIVSLTEIPSPPFKEDEAGGGAAG